MTIFITFIEFSSMKRLPMRIRAKYEYAYMRSSFQKALKHPIDEDY